MTGNDVSPPVGPLDARARAAAPGPVDLGAVAAGAALTSPVQDQFYGDRTGGLRDPFGHSWHVATHIEDVTPEEMARRLAEASRAAEAA